MYCRFNLFGLCCVWVLCLLCIRFASWCLLMMFDVLSLVVGLVGLCLIVRITILCFCFSIGWLGFVICLSINSVAVVAYLVVMSYLYCG